MMTMQNHFNPMRAAKPQNIEHFQPQNPMWKLWTPPIEDSTQIPCDDIVFPFFNSFFFVFFSVTKN